MRYIPFQNPGLSTIWRFYPNVSFFVSELKLIKMFFPFDRHPMEVQAYISLPHNLGPPIGRFRLKSNRYEMDNSFSFS